MADHPWTVLLIGGPSGAGKSELSGPLARRLEVGLVEIDVIQQALEAVTTPEHLPVLHFWRTHRDEFMAWSDEQRRDHIIRVCREVFAPALTAVIADRLATGSRAVIEGDFVLPELATVAMFGAEPNDGRVRGLFVLESDEAQLTDNYVSREGMADAVRVRASRLLSEWLRNDCARLGVPTVAARPWATVVDRAIALVDR